MSIKSTMTLTKENFEQEVLNYDGVAMVDFWAPWCGPCKAIGPTIDEIADEYIGKAKVAKLNIDDAGEISANYRVMNIPTILVFKNGEMVEKVVGVRTKKDLIKMLDEHI
ncbi:MAG: thioredoxin [Clostridium sp.]|nr:thioredoxin [Clostridium sp.]